MIYATPYPGPGQLGPLIYRAERDTPTRVEYVAGLRQQWRLLGSGLLSM